MLDTPTGMHDFTIESGEEDRSAILNFFFFNKPGVINIESIHLRNLVDGEWGTCMLPSGQFIISEKSFIEDHIKIEEYSRELASIRNDSSKKIAYQNNEDMNRHIEKLNSEIELSVNMLNSHNIIDSGFYEGARFAEFTWGHDKTKELSISKQNTLSTQVKCPYGIDNIIKPEENNSYFYKIWNCTQYKLLESFIGEVSGVILEQKIHQDEGDSTEFVNALKQLFNGNIKTITL